MSDLPDGISDGKCPACGCALQFHNGVFSDPPGTGPRVGYINDPPRLREGWWCPNCGEYGTETMLDAVAGGLTWLEVEELEEASDNRLKALGAIRGLSAAGGDDSPSVRLERINAIAGRGMEAEYDPNEEVTTEQAEERGSSGERGDEQS